MYSDLNPQWKIKIERYGGKCHRATNNKLNKCFPSNLLVMILSLKIMKHVLWGMSLEQIPLRCRLEQASFESSDSQHIPLVIFHW